MINEIIKNVSIMFTRDPYLTIIALILIAIILFIVKKNFVSNSQTIKGNGNVQIGGDIKNKKK